MEIFSKSTAINVHTKSNEILEHPLFNALKFGAKGFITFFLTFLVVTTLAYITGISNSFDIGIREVISSIAGFLLLFLVKIMETKKEEKG